jgi:hypothetical protein
MVTFVFTNPKHHLDMMVPVARILTQRGVSTRFVSLAELRGFATPDLGDRLIGVEVRRTLPHARRNPSLGAEIGTAGPGRGLRALLQRVLWGGLLGPRLRQLLRGSSVVVVPNDAAFPYRDLAKGLRVRGTPFALLQEGIRFPLPGEQAVGAPYGTSGAQAICVWGEGSATHFRSIGAPAARIRVTGNPRFDDVSPSEWRDRGLALRGHLGLDRAPLVYLSNTIDDQGFCTTTEKMRLFETFLRAAAPTTTRLGLPIVIKLHARESVHAFREVAARFKGVIVLEDAPLFGVLAMAQAAVVLASTVGLEALAFDVPLGVLEIPGHGHVFDYVASGAAIGLRTEQLAQDIEALLTPEPNRVATARAFLDRHMAHRGYAARNIADCLMDLSHRRVS